MKRAKRRSTEQIKIDDATSHCVIYRTGGMVEFKWHRTDAMSHGKALEESHRLARLGHPTHVERYAQSVAVGLPESYEAKD